MASILIFLLLLVIFTTKAQQGQSITILPGSSLSPTTSNSSWLSPSGLYAFGFYPQTNGYAVGVFIAGIPEKTVVWTANRDNPPVPSNVNLNFTSDGRLILQSAEGQETDIANSIDGAASASMLDSGNFVLYNSANKTIWQSFDNPTDTLLPGQNFQAGQNFKAEKVLYSSVSDTDKSRGNFTLIMQLDGWLVLYPIGKPYTIEYGYWQTGKEGGVANASLKLDDDGHLYTVDSNGTIIKDLIDGRNSTKGRFFLRIDADGIMRLYSHNNGILESPIFQQPTDKCAPKGICGLNGFCTQIDLDTVCKCLPGFARINESNAYSDCERNFAASSCESNDDASSKYVMETVLNTIWENITTGVPSLSTQQECAAACLQDCNCEAALFKDGVCTKQRLPLRFGRRVQLLYIGSTSALIKVGNYSTPTSNKIPPEGSKKELRVEILIIGVSFFALGIIMLTISGIAIYRSRIWAYQSISENGNVTLSEDVALQSFTYLELEKATDGFKEELGRGSFGIVYKGVIWKGQKVVAVKRLERLLAEREREFQTEMKVIGKTHHKNLVRLLGYCHEGPNRLLVYEYMTNGSLADVLFTPEKQPGWDERMEIGHSIARGIRYLHEECETQIIHCDIKPQNILMDANMCPKVSDFGLAKLLKPDQTKTMTDIRGTRGYVAPEWHRKRPVTVKVDVYSFGIVLLELICCRKSVEMDLPVEEAVLEELAYNCFMAGEVGKLVGDEKVEMKELERMVKVGIWCIQDDPSLRPSMNKVLLMLEGNVDIPIPPAPASFFFTSSS